MKRFLSKFLALTVIWLATGAWTEIGLNFRASSDYVVDGANQTYVLGDVYPTTRAGVTFGFTSALSDGTRNRDSGVDVRLAGINQSPVNSARTFRVDLSATGTYTICVANGDAVFSQGEQYLEFFDDTISLFTIEDLGTNSINGGNFNDATGVERTAAAWPGSNVCQVVSMTTTSLFIDLGTGADGTYGTLAHVSITAGGDPPTTTTTTSSTTTTTLPAVIYVGDDW